MKRHERLDSCLHCQLLSRSNERPLRTAHQVRAKGSEPEASFVPLQASISSIAPPLSVVQSIHLSAHSLLRGEAARHFGVVRVIVGDAIMTSDGVSGSVMNRASDGSRLSCAFVHPLRRLKSSLPHDDSRHLATLDPLPIFLANSKNDGKDVSY
uniref:Uncharacterized protein n=1 Tax=Parascaris univalens TaxID=6257 RepID=A0A915A3M7_PARUN